MLDKARKDAEAILAAAKMAANDLRATAAEEWKQLETAVLGHQKEVQAHQARILFTENARSAAEKKLAEAKELKDKLTAVSTRLKVTLADL
jgi:hypothetical protein